MTKLFSRYIKFHEFENFARQVQGAYLLIPIMGTLCLKGLVRGSFIDEICYSIQGVYPITKEIGDAYMISDPDLLKKYPLTPHKSARVVLEDSFKEFHFKAVQIQVPDDFHVRWCESLGFKRTTKIGEKVFLHILK